MSNKQAKKKRAKAKKKIQKATENRHYTTPARPQRGGLTGEAAGTNKVLSKADNRSKRVPFTTALLEM